jgi:hypothetical protein
MKKGSGLQEDIVFPTHMQQMTEFQNTQSKMGRSSAVAGDTNTCFSTTERRAAQKFDQL